MPPSQLLRPAYSCRRMVAGGCPASIKAIIKLRDLGANTPTGVPYTEEEMLAKCMSTRSTSSNIFSPLRDPESLIRRRNLGEPSSLFNFEEVMSIPHNNMGPPPAGAPPPPNNGPPPVVRPNGPAPR
ncbi:hypothetical protein Tco_0025961 [Tanacetum coccineum]